MSPTGYRENVVVRRASRFEIDELCITGWSALQSSNDIHSLQLPLLWTPTITRIWTDAILDWFRPTTHAELDLRKLHVSGDSHW